jgi:hypothetical protein
MKQKGLESVSTRFYGIAVVVVVVVCLAQSLVIKDIEPILFKIVLFIHLSRLLIEITRLVAYDKKRQDLPETICTRSHTTLSFHPLLPLNEHAWRIEPMATDVLKPSSITIIIVSSKFACSLSLCNAAELQRFAYKKYHSGWQGIHPCCYTNEYKQQ